MNKFNYGDKLKVSFGSDIDFTYLSAHPNRDNMHFVYNSILGATCALDSEVEVVESATQNASYKTDYENATEALTKIAQVINMQYGLNCGYENLPDRVQGAIDCQKLALKEASTEIEGIRKLLCERKNETLMYDSTLETVSNLVRGFDGCLAKIANSVGHEWGVDCGFGNLHKYVRNTIDNHKNHGEHLDNIVREMREDFEEIALSIGKKYGADVTHKSLTVLIKDKVGQQELSTRTINHQAKEISKLSAQVGILEKELGDSRCIFEWDGNGIPPVGCECWICFTGGNDHYGLITYVGDGVFCYKKLTDNKERCVGSLGKNVVTFKPSNETPEEKAGRDLYELSCKSLSVAGIKTAGWDFVAEEYREYWKHFAKQLGFTTGI